MSLWSILAAVLAMAMVGTHQRAARRSVALQASTVLGATAIAAMIGIGWYMTSWQWGLGLLMACMIGGGILGALMDYALGADINIYASCAWPLPVAAGIWLVLN